MMIIISFLCFSMLPMFTPQAKATSLPPVGYWKFDEGSGSIAHDSSGNGQDGTVYGAGWTEGISDKALQFDGVDDYVEVPDNPSLSGFSQLKLCKRGLKLIYYQCRRAIL